MSDAHQRSKWKSERLSCRLHRLSRHLRSGLSLKLCRYWLDRFSIIDHGGVVVDKRGRIDLTETNQLRALRPPK